MIFVHYKNWFFALTGLLVAASLGALLVHGLHLSIDFTGGTLAEVHYTGELPSSADISQTLTNLGVADFSIRSVGTDGYIIRAGQMSQEVQSALGSALSINGAYKAVIDQVTQIGPTIGTELRNKALAAITVVLLAILLFIAFAFRKVSRPVSSWVYGIIALTTLVHDIILPLGFFAVYSALTGAQVDTLFVTAILTILGYSVHNTIVVFDRVRENLHLSHSHKNHDAFREVVGKSLNQTIVRSTNTSVTVLISLAALYLVGPAATQSFALTLIVGVIAGTYSSVCIAAPMLVAIEQYRTKRS